MSVLVNVSKVNNPVKRGVRKLISELVKGK
jgi:hypothetical protein